MANDPGIEPSKQAIESNSRLEDVERFTKHPTTRIAIQIIALFALDKYTSTPYYFGALLGLSFGLAAFRSAISKNKGSIRWVGLIAYLLSLFLAISGILGVFKQVEINDDILVTVSSSHRSFGYCLSIIGLLYIKTAYIWVTLLLASILDWILITSPNEVATKQRLESKKTPRAKTKKKKRR